MQLISKTRSEYQESLRDVFSRVADILASFFSSSLSLFIFLGQCLRHQSSNLATADSQSRVNANELWGDPKFLTCLLSQFRGIELLK